MTRRADNDNEPLRLMGVKDTAKMLAISVSTLRELVRAGEIAFIQKGRGSERQHMSFHPQDVEDYIKRSRTRLCLSTNPKTVRTTISTSSSEDKGFMAQRAARIAAKQKAKSG